MKPLSLAQVRERTALVKSRGTVRHSIEGKPEKRNGKWYTPRKSYACILVAPGRGIPRATLLGALRALRVRLKAGYFVEGGIEGEILRFRWNHPDGRSGGLDLKLFSVSKTY